MTSTQDPSLLTDEERTHYDMISKLVANLGPMNIGIDAMDDLRVTAFIASEAFTSLVAARAENKRLLQDLLDTRELGMMFLAENKQLGRGICKECHTQSWEPTSDGLRCSYCWLLAENVRLAHENKRTRARIQELEGEK